MPFVAKRIHDAPSDDDGLRVLVDRLWPRGVSKEKAALDSWPKQVTPSTELRKAVHAEEISWESFETSYRKELEADDAQAALEELRLAAEDGTVTLLTAVKDPTGAHVGVLLRVLQQE